MDWQFEAVEQAMINATYWNVNLYNTLDRNDGFMREDFSLIGTITGLPGHEGKELRNLDAAVRPYVMAASAEPKYQHFNMRTKAFELILRGKPVDAPMVIYVPAVHQHPWQPVHYVDGFDVLYNGNVFKEWTMETNQLSFYLDSTVDLHSINVRPRAHHP